MSGAPKQYPWPACIANWQAFSDGEPLLETVEYPVHTDAWVTGQVESGLGPYTLLNSFGAEHEPTRYPAIILRVNIHLPQGALKHSLSVTDATAYHAGDIEDELSALLGMCVGIRTKAGGFTRRFDPSGDQRGQPFAGVHKAVPPLLKPGFQRRWILPRLGKTHCLDGALTLGFRWLPTLNPNSGASLVKAARLHQEAVWIAEGAPELSWFLLVTAVETCAKAWAVRTGKSGTNWGPTGRFREFLLAFCPEPPNERPKECYQHKWDRATLKASFSKVYDWRSDFVHEGVLFPKPMCVPPHREDGLFSEIPIGLAMSAQGGKWQIADTPLLLHLFEYIVRGAILNWWKWSLPSVPFLNSAGQARLKRIPGVGVKLARRIARHRRKHGPFGAFAELTGVKGIGDGAVKTIREHTSLVKK